MHEYQKRIREQLAAVPMSRSQRENLVAELASHLEDLHAELLASGVRDPEASAHCLKQLKDVRQIAAAANRCRDSEGTMNQRTRSLWFPGLITLTMASVSLMVMQLFAFSRPRVHWVEGGAMAVGILWLFSLLPCGALGAYLSLRSGGSRSTAIVASLFPSLVMLAVFCLVLPIRTLLERNPYLLHHPRYFALAMLAWIVVPGATLLLGALPVLGKMNPGSQGHSHAPRTTG